MTRRDFELIASVFKAAGEQSTDPRCDATIVALARRMSIALEEEHERFDPAIFLIACGIVSPGPLAVDPGLGGPPPSKLGDQ